MAARVPKEKAIELIELYGGMLKAGHTMDEMAYWRAVRELSGTETANSISALGFVHALVGNVDKAIEVFEKGLELKDIAVANNYCFTLRQINNFSLLRDKSYVLAETYGTKELTEQAFSSAYRFGDREKLIYFFDKHIKLLSEQEGRIMAEKHKKELLIELDDAFNTSKCTKKEFDLLTNIVWSVVERNKAKVGYVELSKKNNKCYVVDIINKNPKEIALMNIELAKDVCMESGLDECDLIARYSPQRELHSGVSYEHM
jgi:tetratricopeptide (TPR) repeat protein